MPRAFVSCWLVPFSMLGLGCATPPVRDTRPPQTLLAPRGIIFVADGAGGGNTTTRAFRRLTAESNIEPYTNSREPWSFSPVDKEDATAITAALGEFTPELEGYEGQFYRFFTALRDGGQPPVTIEDARRSLEFIAAVYHSSESGERVDLPLGKQHPKYYGW